MSQSRLRYENIKPMQMSDFGCDFGVYVLAAFFTPLPKIRRLKRTHRET